MTREAATLILLVFLFVWLVVEHFANQAGRR